MGLGVAMTAGGPPGLAGAPAGIAGICGAAGGVTGGGVTSPVFVTLPCGASASTWSTRWKLTRWPGRKRWIKVNQGIDNDLVRISVDGVDLGQCFTTWENYYRTAPEQNPPPNRNTPATINSLQFRSSVPGPPALAGNGYLFDNVSITPSNGPGPPGCDVPIEKTADSPTVTAGGRAGYKITVRNRGRLAARNLRACDRI